MNVSNLANPVRYEWEQGLIENLGKKLGLSTKRDVQNFALRKFSDMIYNQDEFTAWLDTIVDEPWHSKNKPLLHGVPSF